MRHESLPAGTLISGLFLLWALALAIAAWLGLGSRLPHAASTLQAQALPQVPALASERLGELAQYSQVVSRPLFNPGRRPQPYYIGGDASEAVSTLRLSGVLITPQLRMATLSGEGGLSLRLQQGGPAVQGWQLLELSERQATVLGPAGSQILPLAVYAGSAAGAPSAAAAEADTRLGAAGGGNGQGTAAASSHAPAAAAPAASSAAPVESPAAATVNEPSAAQMQAIRARIQARREQMRQNNNGQDAGQNR